VLPAWPPKDLWVYNVTERDTIIVPGTVLGQMEPVSAPVVNLVTPGQATGHRTTATEQLKPQEPPCKEPFESSEKETGEGGRLWAALDELIDPNVPPEVRQRLLRVWSNMLDCFAFSNADLGRCTVMKHQIETGDAKTISRALYPTERKQRDLIRGQVEEMLGLSIIEEAMGPWGSPVLLVPKKDGSGRFCVDYRKLNAVTVKDVLPIAKNR